MNHSGQKLWGLLLVVDSFFVVIFGGAFAAKIYESWQAPSHEFLSPAPKAMVNRDNHPHPAVLVSPSTVKPLAPTTISAKTPNQTTPKLNETKLATPKTATSRKKQISSRAKHKYQEPQILPSRGPDKARGVTFHYYEKKARRVILVSSFLRGGKKALKKSRHGPWQITVYLMPGKYRYLFMVDGKKILDPRNPRHKGRFSFFSLEK
jgi:hypothetical protein